MKRQTDIADRVRDEIEQLRAGVPGLSDPIAIIRAVESIRALESQLADLLALRQRSAMAKGRVVPATAVVVAAPVSRRPFAPPVRAATPPVRAATPAAQPDPWAAQRTRCLQATVRVYAAVVQSRENGLD